MEKYAGGSFDLNGRFNTRELRGRIHTRQVLAEPLENRAFWEAAAVMLPGLKRFIKEEKNKNLTLSARLYREYTLTGNRHHYEEVHCRRRYLLSAYVLAEAMSNTGEYIEDIVDLIWMILEESTWCIPAHAKMQPTSDSLPDVNAPSLDLFSATTAVVLTYAAQIMKNPLEKISRNIVPRIRQEVISRITEEFLRNDTYHWMGFMDPAAHMSNWTPSMTDRVLQVSAAWVEDSDMLYRVTEKGIRVLQRYIDGYPADGASDEGPSYWCYGGLSMLVCLRTLEQITNRYVHVWEEAYFRNALEYIAKVYIGEKYFINHADCSPEKITPCATIYKFSQLVHSEIAEAFAISQAETVFKAPVESPSLNSRMMDQCAYLPQMLRMKAPDIVFRDVWFDSTQVAVMRQNETRSGLYLAVKGGHNGQCHNHNDVGSFIVYKNAQPFVVDPSQERYTAQTFSDRRYEIWCNRSAYHNVPMIGGYEQAAGAEYGAEIIRYEQNDERAVILIELRGAYPHESGVVSWKRQVEMDRVQACVRVCDQYELERPERVEICLMVFGEVNKTEQGLVIRSDRGDELRIVFEAEAFEVSMQKINSQDEVYRENWHQKELIRVELKTREARTDGRIEMTMR